MHVGAAFVADEQALEVVQPGEGALDDPALASESGSVLGLAASDHRLNPPLPEQVPVLIVVVAAVGDQAIGTATRAANRTGDRRNGVEERDQLGDVVAVAAGDRPREREPAAVDEEVVLGAGAASVDRARARRGAPLAEWLSECQVGGARQGGVLGGLLRAGPALAWCAAFGPAT